MPDLTFLRPIQAMVLIHNVTPSQALCNLPFVGSWAYVMNGAYVSDISAMFSLEHEMLFTLLRHNTVSIVSSTVSLVTNIMTPKHKTCTFDSNSNSNSQKLLSVLFAVFQPLSLE